MPILDAEYAAELIMKDGEVIKFDHPICMIQYFSGSRKVERSRVKKMFVMDYNTRRWIPADSAIFIRGDFRTPVMDYNVLAMRDSSRAREFCRVHRSELLSLAEMWIEYSEPDRFFRLTLQPEATGREEILQASKGDIVQLRVTNGLRKEVRIAIRGYDNVTFYLAAGATLQKRFIADKPGDYFAVVEERTGTEVARLMVTGPHLAEEGKANDEF
jgi:hypothetical protein